MRLLLDTHAFIWWDEGVLAKSARQVIVGADEVFVSAVSGWEIAIKAALGKIRVRGATAVADAVADYGFAELPITLRHAEAVRALPLHHGDPFDRLLIAQAIAEGLTVVTSDRKFEPYRVLVQWL
jgi:PIN domain nuclease of toxin-antitoxin system